MNVRDFFSAGGQYDLLNGEKLPIPLPAVLKKLQDVMPCIERNLRNNKDLEYMEFNPELFYSKNKLRTWIGQVVEIFNKYKYLYNRKEIRFKDLNIDVPSYLLYPQKHILRQSK